jgi:hypothetical protein
VGIDFNRLRGLVRDAARAAFDEVRAAHSGEVFYAFALYTDGDAMTAVPAANSEQGYRRAVDRRGETGPAELAYLRWATAEWAYEAAGDAHFRAATDLLNAPGRYDPADDRAARAYTDQFHATLIGALRDLDAEGFFGTGEARAGVTLFVTISDSGAARQLENRSARQLNPKPVYRRFMSRFE